MCIGIPSLVIAKDGIWGTVDTYGNRQDIVLSLVPEAAPGSWVLVHAGVAIGEIDEAGALQTLALLKELDTYE